VKSADGAGRRFRDRVARLWPAVFSALWLASLALALAMSGLGLYHARNYYNAVDRGLAEFGLRDQVVGQHIALVSPISRFGDLATIQPGDVILTINGKPAPNDISQEAALVRLMRAEGPSVTLRTRSTDGTLRDHRVERSPKHQATMRAASGLDMWSLTVARLTLRSVAAVLILSAGVLLFTRRARDPLAALLSIAFCGMATIVGPSTPGFGYVPGYNLIVGSVNVVGSTAMLLGVLLFPGWRLETRFARIVAAAVIVWGAFIFLDLFDVTHFGNATDPIDVLLIILCGAVLVMRYRRTPPGPQRQQIRWATLGMALGALVLEPLRVVAFNVGRESSDVQLAAWALVSADALSVALSLAIAGGFVISLLRYRLYDADMVISRSAGYAILTLALAGVWAGAEKALEVLFAGQFGHEAGAASAGVAAALAALLVTPAHHRVMHWTEQVFQRALARLRRDLPERVGDLRETASLADLLDTVLTETSAGVRAVRGAVALAGEAGPIAVAVRGVSDAEVAEWLLRVGHAPPMRDRDDPFLPLRLPLTDGGGTFGWLLLGPRPDGSFYGRDELDALEQVAGPVARAVRIVLAREAKDRLWQTRMDGFAAEMLVLRRTVAAPSAPRPA
jgi:hypothetical protein